MTCSLLSIHKIAMPTRIQRHSGFTLIEIAVVIMIVGFLLGTILGPLSTQQENRKIKETEQLLEEVREALTGFAALNGFLPCPATAGSNGFEARVAGPQRNAPVLTKSVRHSNVADENVRHPVVVLDIRETP